MVSAFVGGNCIVTALSTCYCYMQVYAMHNCCSLQIFCSVIIASLKSWQITWYLIQTSQTTSNTFCSSSCPFGKLKNLYLLYFLSFCSKKGLNFLLCQLLAAQQLGLPQMKQFPKSYFFWTQKQQPKATYSNFEGFFTSH